jgi:hypothetical protein
MYIQIYITQVYQTNTCNRNCYVYWHITFLFHNMFRPHGPSSGEPQTIFHISKKTLSPNGSVVFSLTYVKCLPFTIQLLFNALIHSFILFILGFSAYHEVDIHCYLSSASGMLSNTFDMLCLFAGEVTLLCLGPLTNIALAIRMDPNFCTNVKEIFIMGGNMEGKCCFIWNKRAGVL